MARMKQTKPFKSLVLASFFAAAAATPLSAQNPLTASPPNLPANSRDTQTNFVFFLVDDMGFSDVGFNGSTFYETPNIDKLAASAATFPNAYAACPVCSPTRASIMTGRHPVRVDVTDWLPGMSESKIRDPRLIQPQDRNELALEEITLAESLKGKGYQTFFVGKWHLGDEGYYPQDQGFDVNIAGNHTGSPKGGYYAPYKNPKLPNLPGTSPYLSDRLTDESIKLLQDRDPNKPFLLYFAFYNVHTPIQANKEFVQHFVDKKQQMFGDSPTPYKPEHTVQTRERQDNPAYASMVSAVDKSVGRVLAELEKQGLSENTVIVFFSDNGGLGCHINGGPTSNDGLRAGKGWLYEGGIREPLIIKAPGITKPGQVINTPVVSMDFFPTFLDLAGYELEPQIHNDGESLLPLLKGQGGAGRALYWHYPHYHGSQWTPGAAVRDGDWKLVEFYHYDKVELYNLVSDPQEQHNLAKANPEKRDELLGKLHAWQKRIGAKMPVANPDYAGPRVKKGRKKK